MVSKYLSLSVLCFSFLLGQKVHGEEMGCCHQPRLKWSGWGEGILEKVHPGEY